MGMNSQRAKDKAINLMNEEEKEVTVEFLMNHLAVEDGNTQHKFLSQINSNSSVNFAAYDRRQNRGKSNRPKCTSGKNEVQNKSRVQTSSSTTQPSRKPPGMAQWKIHYMPKEVYILSRPSEFQPVADYITQYTHREPATAVSQSLITSNKLWVDQCRMVTILRVYRRTRSMLKIRCTNIRQTRHNYSQSTETEKAKFQTLSTYNDERNFVKCNSVKKISDDLVHPTKSDTTSTSASIFSEEREEIAAEIPAPAPAPAPVPTLETVEEQPYTPGSRKSMRKNLGRPASTFSTCKRSKTLSQPGSVDYQYKVELSTVYKS